MLKDEKIFFFEKISIYNLLFIIVLKVFFFKNKLFYRNISQEVNKIFILKILKRLDLKHLNYKTTGHIKYLKNFSKENLKLTNPVLKKLKKNENYKSILKYYNLGEKSTEVLDIFLSKSLAGNYLTAGYSSLNLLKHNFGKTKKIFYFPENLGNFLIIKENSDLNIKPIFLLVFIKNLIKLLVNLFVFKKNKIKQNKNVKVLFCPHQSLYYGNAYKKNFIFKDIYEKKFKNDEIIVADYEHQCKITKRYYKRFNINEINFQNFQKINFLKIIFLIFKIKRFDYSNFYYFFFIIYILNNLENCIKFLKSYQNLKVAIFSYDINANTSLILACNILKIKTFSFQERSNAYVYTPYMYFDEYFISGPKIKKLFSNNFYRFDRITVAPLPRSALIKNLRIQNLKKNIICLPPPHLDELSRVNFGDILSENTINKFYEIVLNLSKCFPNYNFLIKSKFSEKNILSLKFAKKIDDLNIKNIKILKNEKKNGLYKLLNNAHILFGTYSSIHDECFSIGKKAVLYDKDYIASEHPLQFTNIYCENFSEIKKNIELIISDKFLYDKKTKDIKRDYFPPFDNNTLDVYSQIISQVNDIIFKNDKL